MQVEHRTYFEVRDNEVDIQGVVNNANYFIYLAHSRHKFLHEKLKINFIEMAKKNLNLFLVETNLQFKKALLPNDNFYVTCNIKPEGKIRFAFEQEIRLVEGDVLIASAKNIGVCMDGNRNRPVVPEQISECFKADNA
jgi:acyl-CoA thioester hydrolase